MKSIAMFVVGGVALTPFLVPQATQITPPELKSTIEGLGYEVKVLNSEVGKEKFEFTLKTEGFNVPVGAEISPSKNYVWFTVFLGKPPTDVSKHTALLKRNQKVQPNFFYITESAGNLMMGIGVDNRGITAKDIKRVTDKLAKDVGDSAPDWQSTGG